MNQEETLKKAKSYVDRLLKIRFRSEKEIRDKLSRKGFQADIINETIVYFKGLKLIDDRRFALLWIVSRLAKPFGPQRIKFELKEKGITPDIISEELAGCSVAVESEAETVFKLAQKQILKYKNLDHIKMKQRLYGFLLRRGFNGSVISHVLRKL